MVPSARSAFGDFLRSRREKLSPDAVGLSGGRRRRTPGLRREEVAERAGIGLDWYVRLEQGRDVTPSATTLDALARALCLGAAERAHLRALSRPASRAGFERETVPDAIRRLIDAMPQPAYVTGRRWDVLAWNAATADLFPTVARAAPDARNILLFMFTDPEARRLFGAGWPAEARRMLALFRATHDVWAHDPAFTALLETLRAGCPDFAAWWEAHELRGPSAGRKTLHHPVRGALCFEYATFQCNDDPALRLAIYTPV